jgi:hypothetical protein
MAFSEQLVKNLFPTLGFHLIFIPLSGGNARKYFFHISCYVQYKLLEILKVKGCFSGVSGGIGQ